MVQRVASESIDVLCLIRADGGSKLFVEGMPVDCETLQGLRHGYYVVINQQVGHQMVVLDELAVALYLNRFLRTFGAGEPADEVLPAHHNGDTAGPLERKPLAATSPGV